MVFALLIIFYFSFFNKTISNEFQNGSLNNISKDSIEVGLADKNKQEVIEITSQPSQDISTLVSKLGESMTWKYYNNKTCGIKVKYPDFFEVSEDGCEIAFYFGNGNSAYSFCPLVHIVFNDKSCGSLAYKETGRPVNNANVNVGGIITERTDYAVKGITLESNFDEIITDTGKTIDLSYYNGDSTAEQAEMVRNLFEEMVQSIEFN